LLDLLPKLFGRIVVPGAVVAEVARGRQMGLNLPEVQRLPWAEVRDPLSPAGVLLAWDLGAGESAVLSLALERQGSWVVLDDHLARQAARSLNVPLLGTAGILLRAKKSGHLPRVAPVLTRLDSLGFRLKAETRHHILRLAGE
jgi:predicted nucleic acid-binding protein